MVAAGYTHSYCTPHIWPNLGNSRKSIPARVAALQAAFDRENVPLRLIPGGEMHFSEHFCELPESQLVTYGDAGRYAIFDFWTNALPGYVQPCLEKIQQAGITPILAHPERIEAIQNDPAAIDRLAAGGLLLQCNLECLADEEKTRRRTLAEAWLLENRYFLIGSDLHRIETLPKRLRGLDRAIDLIGEERVWELTHVNPATLASLE
jgi:protein-tyrosine phosphatase